MLEDLKLNFCKGLWIFYLIVLKLIFLEFVNDMDVVMVFIIVVIVNVLNLVIVFVCYVEELVMDGFVL